MKNALGSAFIDILSSIGVRQHVSGPTHCRNHTINAVNSTPSYKYGRTITSTTKDCFVSNLPDLSQFLSTSNSTEKT